MKIGIIGLGLIGGSLAMSLRRHTEHTVFGYDINPQVVLQAKAMEAIHDSLDEDTLLTEVTAIVSKTVHDNCRPTNRLYKTEASRGLTADLFSLLLSRED